MGKVQAGKAKTQRSNFESETGRFINDLRTLALEMVGLLREEKKVLKTYEAPAPQKKETITLDQAIQNIESELRKMMGVCAGASAALSESKSDFNENLGWGLNDQFESLKKNVIVLFEIFSEPGVWDAVVMARACERLNTAYRDNAGNSPK